MKTCTDNTTPSNSRRRATGPRYVVGHEPRRRGIASGLLIVTLVFLSGFIALAINTSRLTCVRTELQAACEAAALAGAAELLDEGVLYGTPDVRDDILMARESARLAGLRNRVDGREFRLDPNHQNIPTGDMVVGIYEPLARSGAPLGIPPSIDEPGPVNTLRITGRLSSNTFNRISLWLGKLTGVTVADPAYTASATLDCRVVGFRPERGVKVPVVPLAAEYQAWIDQASAAPVADVNDRYGIDPLTGEVTGKPDGIAELVFLCGAPTSAAASTVATAPASQTAASTNADASDESEAGASQPAPGWCVVPELDNELNIPYVWPVRAREGLSIGDLAPYGGQLVVPGPPLEMPVLTGMPGELGYGLMEILGRSRVWPLADSKTDGSPPTCEVVGFAAGRIVYVGRGSGTENDTWEIVVQPTTLISSQAVTRAAAPRNPWIGKLELTQ